MSAATGQPTGGVRQVGLPRATVVASAVAIAFVSIATFAGMRWYGSRAAAQTLEGEIAAAREKEAELRQQLAPLATQLETLEERTGILATGTLAVCNTSSQPVTVTRVAAIFTGADGEFRTFNSDDHGDHRWRLAPGEVRELTHPRADWDGSVSFYSLWIQDASGERPYSGTWPAQAGHCVRYPGT